MKQTTPENEQQPNQGVLHITFNMGFGGTEQVIRQLLMHLPKDRFTNEILCIDGKVGEIGQGLEAEHGTRVHRLERQPGLDWRLALNIRRLIKHGDFSIVHCHQYTPWFYGWLGSLGTGVRLVFTEHGRFHPDTYRRKAWLINKFMALTTQHLVAISKATREALTEYEFIPRRWVQVIYNGIAPLKENPEKAEKLRESLGIPESGFVCGTVSRLDPVKNQRMMLKAFSMLHRDCDNNWLLMVGDGPDSTMLKQYAVELGIAERVVFTGFQSEPGPYLAAMDVFLLSSHTEGTSMTLLEAMSLGKPCVVTNVGGNPELVNHGVNGLLVPTDNPDAMFQAMAGLQKNSDQMESMGQKAQNRFHLEFAAEQMAQQYAGCYQPTEGY